MAGDGIGISEAFVNFLERGRVKKMSIFGNVLTMFMTKLEGKHCNFCEQINSSMHMHRGKKWLWGTLISTVNKSKYICQSRK